MYKSLIKILFICFLSFTTASIYANEEHTEKSKEHQEKEKFNPGDFIFEHIRDNYNWHLYTYKEHHVAIPLPVILYTKDKGLQTFWSFKLEHGNIYKGFKIAEEGDYKDKIIKVDENGEFIDRPLDFSITKNVVAIWISGILLIIIFISVARMYEKRKDVAPKGLQSLLEPLILFIRDDIAKNSIGEYHYEKYNPVYML